MKKSLITSLSLAAVFTLGTAISSFAAVPPPPVNQKIGIPDTVFNTATEQICRSCHNQTPPAGIPVDGRYLPDRHHLLVDTAILDTSEVRVNPFLNPDANNDGILDPTYDCLNCHKMSYDPIRMVYDLDPNFRDCLLCHLQGDGPTVHHKTALAAAQDCKACHGDRIDNPGDGHTIPTYQPSLVTPWPSGKPNGDDTVLPNSAGTYAGNCNFCHNTADGALGMPGMNLEETWIIDDPTIPTFVSVPVYDNRSTHHSTGVADTSAKCLWCHLVVETDPVSGMPVIPPSGYNIRTCENCHGIGSLHNIAWDSTGDGMVTPGAEMPGYSHIGSQDDCWGCHGNNGVIMNAAPASGPTIPQIDTISSSSMASGADTTVTLTGNNLTNYIENPWTGSYDIYVVSGLLLTDAAGVETALTAVSVTEDSMEVVIPGTLAAGNFKVQAQKGPKVSSPLNLTITPGISIDSAICVRKSDVLTISGSGFGSYLVASDSGTSVEMDGETGEVISWSDTQIVAQFNSCEKSATVNTVFGSASTSVDRVRK